MKIKLTRNIYISGKAVSAGETVDVSETDAKNLITMKKAVALEDTVEEPRETGAPETSKDQKTKSEKAKGKGK